MNSIGTNIKRLRLSKGDTQERLAEELHVSCQAVSKWENSAALPDISMLPLIADHFGITIDELLGHKLNSYTYKERFVRLMYHSGVLSFNEDGSYIINTENFTTNAQIAKIGECFADLIRENNLTFDVIMGMAYHGIAFSSAAAFSLYQKYGVSASYCYDRKCPDSRGREICGYTLNKGDKVILIDDVIGSGNSLDARLESLISEHGVDVVAVLCIVDSQTERKDNNIGSEYIRNKYGVGIYTLVSDSDIQIALEKRIIVV